MEPPAAASAESEFALEGMVRGTMATECMAESRKEGLPGSWLCIIIL